MVKLEFSVFQTLDRRILRFVASSVFFSAAAPNYPLLSCSAVYATEESYLSLNIWSFYCYLAGIL